MIIGQLLEKGNTRKTFTGSQEELAQELAQGWRKVSDDELADEKE